MSPSPPPAPSGLTPAAPAALRPRARWPLAPAASASGAQLPPSHQARQSRVHVHVQHLHAIRQPAKMRDLGILAPDRLFLRTQLTQSLFLVLNGLVSFALYQLQLPPQGCLSPRRAPSSFSSILNPLLRRCRICIQSAVSPLAFLEFAWLRAGRVGRREGAAGRGRWVLRLCFVMVHCFHRIRVASLVLLHRGAVAEHLLALWACHSPDPRPRADRWGLKSWALASGPSTQHSQPTRPQPAAPGQRGRAAQHIRSFAHQSCPCAFAYSR